MVIIMASMVLNDSMAAMLNNSMPADCSQEEA